MLQCTITETVKLSLDFETTTAKVLLYGKSEQSTFVLTLNWQMLLYNMQKKNKKKKEKNTSA